MSFLVNWLNNGSNQPNGKGWKAGISRWLGRRLALRHRGVTVAGTAQISPGAFIDPRGGNIGIGENCLISSGAMIQGNVCIGDNSSVQNYSMIVGYGKAGPVVIGKGVRIAGHCMIIAGNHNFSDLSRPIHEQGLTPLPIVIEDDVWIGGNVNIVAGVTIGSGSVIGAGSVVTKDIPPMSVAVGCPAKVIKQRT